MDPILPKQSYGRSWHVGAKEIPSEISRSDFSREMCSLRRRCRKLMWNSARCSVIECKVALVLLTLSFQPARGLEKARHDWAWVSISSELLISEPTEFLEYSSIHRCAVHQVQAVYLLTHRLWEIPEVRHRRVSLMRPCNDDRGSVWCSGDEVSLLFRR
jgi:hypothetical protein